MINYVGAKAVPIRLREELDFRLDVDELAGLINDRTKLIILNSPQNPTGGVLEKKDIDDIARAIGDRNVMVLSDEIYSRLIFEGEHHSIMSIDGMKERTILLDGFSKTYAMTGWRMGYGVMRADLAAHISRLMTNSNSCTASFTQIAGIEALRGIKSRSMRCALSSRNGGTLWSPVSTRSKASHAGRLTVHSMFFRTSQRPGGHRKNWPTRCSTTPASQRSPVPPSAISAKATCASALPTPSRTSRKHSSESAIGQKRICSPPR